MTEFGNGWAIVSKGKVLVNTVSPTRVGAIVNWLVVDCNILVTNSASDNRIEAYWKLNKGKAECVEVHIAVRQK